MSAISLVLNTWALSIQGLGNQYYAAAARSMSQDWGNFFFLALDPGGFISVDKPPLQLWVEALSVRLFGYSSWSLLLPSAVAGAAAVALLWCTVRRRFGVVAGTVAASVLAISPVNVAVNRLNLPEPFLVLLLVAAAWAVTRSADSAHPYRWLAAGGAFVGLAFNTKMLAAYVPGPAFAAAIVVGAASWRARILGASVFAGACAAVSIPWIVVVGLVDAGVRPYVGGSTDNTVLDLVFGYNGLGRVTGGGGGGPRGGGGPGAGAMGAAGGVFGGTPGPLRLVGDALAGQVGWFLPLAVVAVGVAAWHHRRARAARAAVVLWAGWFGLYAAVFSYAGGTFHAYYTSVMVPAVGALVGVGAAAMVSLLQRSTRWWLVVGGGIGAAMALQLAVVARTPGYHGWTAAGLVVGTVAAVGLVAAGYAWRRGRLVSIGLATILGAVGLAPAAWALSEAATPVLNATLPQAGPRVGGAAATFGSSAWNGDPALAAFLTDHANGERWDLAVGNAQSASGLIAYHDLSVMALGGFMGSDPAITVDGFAGAVAAGEVRFVLVSGSGGPSRGAGSMSSGTGAQVLTAVRGACVRASTTDAGHAVPAAYVETLYDCAGRSAALLARR